MPRCMAASGCLASSQIWIHSRRIKGENLARYHVFAVALAAMFATLAQAQTEDHPYTTEQILAGATLYGVNCQNCHANSGDGIGGVNLAHQQFKRAVSDDDIRATIHAGVPGAGMPAFPSLKDEDLWSLVAYIRSGFDKSGSPFKLGDKTRGKAVFEAQGCGGCHTPRGDGPHSAPSLSTIGLMRVPADLVRVINDPSKSMYPINRPVTIVTKTGRTIHGRRLNEDTYTVQVVDQDNNLLTLMKSDIKSFEKSNVSAMPSYAGKISDSDLADLIAYLVSLKGV